jgi:hypothetical protein
MRQGADCTVEPAVWKRDRLGWVLVAVGLVVVGGAPLPTWARAGFTPPDQTTTYVQGAGGDIVGVLFGWPLTAPPSRDRQNKILWVARVSEGGDPLRITARLASSDVVARRQVQSGPGPSIIDLPAAGCWRFDLTWSVMMTRSGSRTRPDSLHGGVAGAGRVGLERTVLGGELAVPCTRNPL